MLIDLGFGNTPIIAEEFKDVFGLGLYHINYFNTVDTNYAPYRGLSKLEDTFKVWAKVHLKLDLVDYYIVPVEGASRGISIVGELLKHKGHKHIYTRPHYYFNLPSLINLPLKTITTNHKPVDTLFLEVPSNPIGDITIPSAKKIILDLAYFAPHYFYEIDDFYNLTIPLHDVLIFSIGKLTGFNSLRLGFLALKNKEDFDFVVERIRTTTMGVSYLVQDFAYNIFSEHYSDWDKFFKQAHVRLTYNRQIFNVIEDNVPGITRLNDGSHSMFAVWSVSSYLYNFLKNNNVIFIDVPFIKPKTKNQKVIRLNLTQSADVMQNFVDLLQTLDLNNKMGYDDNN